MECASTFLKVILAVIVKFCYMQRFSFCQYLLDPEEQVIPYTMNELLYSLSNVGATKVGGKKRAGSIVLMEDIHPSPQNY